MKTIFFLQKVSILNPNSHIISSVVQRQSHELGFVAQQITQTDVGENFEFPERKHFAAMNIDVAELRKYNFIE